MQGLKSRRDGPRHHYGTHYVRQVIFIFQFSWKTPYIFPLPICLSPVTAVKNEYLSHDRWKIYRTLEYLYSWNYSTDIFSPILGTNESANVAMLKCRLWQYESHSNLRAGAMLSMPLCDMWAPCSRRAQIFVAQHRRVVQHTVGHCW